MPGEPFNAFVVSLPVASALAGSEALPIVQAGVTKQTPVSSLAAIINPGYSARDIGVDTPLTTIFTPTQSGMYWLNMGVVCTVLDAGAPTPDIALAYTDYGGAQAATSNVVLNTVGNSGFPASGGRTVFLVAGQPVQISVILAAGGYGTAKYSVFASVTPLF